jgi:hypothetical protein
MARNSAVQKHVVRHQDQAFSDWFAELQDTAGERSTEVATQAPTDYALWIGGASVAQALHMVSAILPPRGAA